MSENNGVQNLFPVNAVHVTPNIRVKRDYYGGGGTFNPLDVGGGPEADFVRSPRASWPAPTIPEGGTPVTFLRQDAYPFDPGAGMPANTERVSEKQTDLAARADRAMRPKQLIEVERLGFPLKPGEGPRYTAAVDEPLDPSVVNENQMGVKRSVPMLEFDTFAVANKKSGWQKTGMFGMGIVVADDELAPEPQPETPFISAPTPAAPSYLTTLLSTVALAPLTKQWTAILGKENDLRSMSAETFAAATQPYAASRADMQQRITAMGADPSKVASMGPLFTASALAYKASLDSAYTKLKDALAKQAAAKLAAAKKAAVTPSYLPALPKAVIKTATSTYGLIVLGVGAALLAGLFLLRGKQQKEG